MTFQYFHGTSSLFVDSIKKHGLGGVNPNFKFGHLKSLKSLFELAEKTLLDKEEFRKIYDTTRAMSLQAKLKTKIDGKDEILNFLHNRIYIALSQERAISYATLNKYGSEILSTSIKLVELLDKYKINYSSINESIVNIRNVKEKSPKPILIKVLSVDENRLDKEDGKTAIEALDFLRSVMPKLTEEQKFRFFQHCNFQIIDPIPASKLEFYEIDFTGKFGQRDFEYTLTRMK
jgi:hypothetical protein